jgi:K+-sensing histidine kinase KdpD
VGRPGDFLEGPILSTSFNAVAAATSDERFARLRAETALFMRDHVLSTVSHDLRSPLNAIHSWAYVLERKLDASDGTAQRALAGIRSGVEQQVKLLDETVDSTRAETKALALQCAPFSIRALVERVNDDVRRALADARNVSITVNCTLNPEQCEGDRERLSQALWVMLTFAVEGSAPGATASFTSSIDAGFWRVEVANVADFAALGANEIPHAFESFARKQAMQPREPGRIAWVLALSQRVAVAHGGTFEQTPTIDGERSRLTLRVPLTAPSQ